MDVGLELLEVLLLAKLESLDALLLAVLESLDVLLLAMLASLDERPVGERFSSDEDVAPEFIAPVLEFEAEPVELLAIVLEEVLLPVVPAVLVARSVSLVELVVLSDVGLAPRRPNAPEAEPEALVVSELATFVLLVLETFVFEELIVAL